MRLLPCRNCGPRGASLPKSVAYPNGEPNLSAGYCDRYVCSKCGRLQTLSKDDWNRLPEMSLEGFERLAKDYKAPQLNEFPLKDVIGAGFTKGQSTDLFRKGIQSVEATEALSRG